MIDYATILVRRYPGKLWTLEGDTYEGLTWNSKGDAPTQKELDAHWPQIQQEIQNETTNKALARKTILDKLGITNDELLAILS